mgnify:CR=1 FL=1
MKVINKTTKDGFHTGYVDGNTHIGVGSEAEEKVLQQIADGLAEYGPDNDLTIVPTVDELRIAAYGSIGDQLDMQYKDALNGTTTWVDHIAAVKAANQK